MRSRPALLSLTLLLLLLRGPHRHYAPGPGISQELRDRLLCLLSLQELGRGDLWVFLPAGFPYVYLHLSGLGDPRSAHGEQVVTRVWLAAVTPPALARVDLVYLVVKVSHAPAGTDSSGRPETFSLGGAAVA